MVDWEGETKFTAVAGLKISKFEEAVNGSQLDVIFLHIFSSIVYVYIDNYSPRFS